MGDLSRDMVYLTAIMMLILVLHVGSTFSSPQNCVYGRKALGCVYLLAGVNMLIAAVSNPINNIDKDSGIASGMSYCNMMSQYSKAFYTALGLK